MKKIAVVFGGKSSEYEVSLKSAYAVLEALDTSHYDILKIGITRTGEWYYFTGNHEKIKADSWQNATDCQRVSPSIGNEQGFLIHEEQRMLAVDVIFPVMHGEFVEDGRIQGVFEWMEIPYVGCKTAASAICMDKGLTHRFAHSIGIQTTASICSTVHDLDIQRIKDFIQKEQFPFFIKPLRGGSSKGISQITEISQLSQAVAAVAEWDTHFIMEKGVEGFEVGCGILGNDELVLGEVDEIELTGSFFDYTEKYHMVSSKIHLPARVSEAMKQEVKYQAERLYRLLGCCGLARIDFFITRNGELLLNEINTMPGFTDNSRYPNMLKEKGFTYSSLLDRLIELAEEGKK
ncbi:D-alanine--D-alanine ligase [Enterococcus sp. BWM-S5]|uniref:D-alanine--D-alanine ligase n=1 Tax=Enterococcus larvae TaxID=2794352 RepID=A0ABS4CLW3_9ENTE|nr:D-alanine--D-alanine ligase family protein [Enterococcus larvae]MBP1047580.1 D-alanine--D-alanine ligase [Enterococcus larvae]